MTLGDFFFLHQSNVRKEVTSSKTFPSHIPSLKFFFVLKIAITLVNNNVLIMVH